MKIPMILAAVLVLVGGPIPAAIMVAAALALHVLRSPDRLLDAAYLAALCGIGYLAR